LLDQLTGIQLAEWEAYDKLDPIGSWRGDFQMACLASIVTNIAISVHNKQGSKFTTPNDFMPDWSGERDEEEQPIQSLEEMKAILLDIAGAQNRKIAKERAKTKK
jgi:Protein of unknown function (DUF4035)